MTAFDTYGTSTHTARQLADLLTDRLGAVFVERDSDYLGIHLLAALNDTTRIQVQPNAIPGDDGDNDLPAGRDLQPLVNLVDTHGTDAFLASVAQLAPEPHAQVTVSTQGQGARMAPRAQPQQPSGVPEDYGRLLDFQQHPRDDT